MVAQGREDVGLHVDQETSWVRYAHEARVLGASEDFNAAFRAPSLQDTGAALKSSCSRSGAGFDVAFSVASDCASSYGWPTVF